MKIKEQNRKTFYRILKTKNNNNNENKIKNLKVKKNFFIRNISLQNINNKNKDILDKVKNLNTNYNKLINKNLSTYNNRLNYLLNTSDIINRAEKTAKNIKQSLIDSDKRHIINKTKFESIREKTNTINKLYIYLKLKEKSEKSKNEIHISEEKNKINSHKIKNALKENILLLKKRKDLESYYIHKSKSQILKDKKNIRFINKIKEYLEILKIKNNKLMDSKDKIIKIQNAKYNINYPKLIKKENLKKMKILLEQIKKDNNISLKNIRDTNSTLFTLNNNKSFLDTDIELKYNHNYNKNKIQKFNKTLNKSNISDENSNNDSFIANNFHILRINKLEEKQHCKDSLINSSIESKKKNIKKKLNYSHHLSKKINLINDSEENEDEKNKLKSKIESLYDEIKEDNILNNNNKEYIEDYFKNKKFILNNKPFQVLFVVNNSLNNINCYNIYKKSKKLYGHYFPHNMQKHLEDLEVIDKISSKIKSRLIGSICHLRMNEA